MRYTKKQLQKMLKDNNITTTTQSIIELVLIALNNNVISQEDIFRQKKEPKKEQAEKKPRGRPRKYPLKEEDPNKVVDPKYYRLRTIRTNPTFIKLTNVDTGDVTKYSSQYKASKATKHGCGFFVRNNGKVVDGILIEIVE